MSRLNIAVEKANQMGQLALMVYAIPNFPDPETYQEIIAVLETHPAVTIIETTLPVSGDFSRFANPVIRQAHTKAVQHGDGTELLNNLQPFIKPSVMVLYRQTLEAVGYEPLLARLEGKIDSLLFEWDADDMDVYAKQSVPFGVELIQCAAPDMSDEELHDYMMLTEEEPLVYLVSAAMTGAELFDVQDLTVCLEKVRKIRPNAKVVAGFGIRTAEDIRRLAAIKGLDGVIVGTAFIEIMSKGKSAVLEYLDSLHPALRREHQSFNAHSYLTRYYGKTCDFDVIDKEMLRFMAEVASENDFTDATILDFASGPAIINIICFASNDVGEIHQSDYFVDNLEEIQRWINADERAFDWYHNLRFALELEMEIKVSSGLYSKSATISEKEIEERADCLRQKITRLLPCDARLDHPLGSDVFEKYDVLITVLGIESVATDVSEWQKLFKNMTNLLKPGGLLVWISALDTTSYWAGDQYFHVIPIFEEDIKNVLADFALEGSSKILVKDLPSPENQIMKGFMAVAARKR